jgi:hypothetical protein
VFPANLPEAISISEGIAKKTEQIVSGPTPEIAHAPTTLEDQDL